MLIQLTEPVDQESLDTVALKPTSHNQLYQTRNSKTVMLAPRLLANFTVGVDFVRFYSEPNKHNNLLGYIYIRDRSFFKLQCSVYYDDKSQLVIYHRLFVMWIVLTLMRILMG
jgi:hypothetical protein